MAESLKVLTAPEKVKDLPASGDRPALVVWRFAVKRGGEDGQTISTELLKHPGNDPPAEGTMVLGDLSQNDYGWRLKLANEAGASGGGGPRGRSPADTKAIQRQHSQEMAIRAMSLMAQLPRRDETPWSKDSVLHNIKELTDWFEKDISES